MRGLDFLTTPSTTMLCSGANDHYVRIWKIQKIQEKTDDEFIVKQELFTLAEEKYRFVIL